MKKNGKGFGPHLMLDLEGVPVERAKDLNLHFQFLSTIPDLVKMTKITQPYVFPYEGLVPSDKGITGIIIIAESHLSIHSFEDKGYTFIDIFSCKPFDHKVVLEEVRDMFKPKKITKRLVKRGLSFPRG